MTSKAPPHLRTGRGLSTCTKHPTDGGCYRRSSGRPRSNLQSKTRDQFLRPMRASFYQLVSEGGASPVDPLKLGARTHSFAAFTGSLTASKVANSTL
jgi:hypothetical protein